MKRTLSSLSFLLALAVNGGAACAALPVPTVDAPAVAAAPAVVDDREASFLPPPMDLKGAEEEAVPEAASPITTTVVPSAPEPVTGGIDLGDPVSSKPLANVDPNSVGLLDAGHGGFGASMWQGTSIALVDQLMPAVSLPTASPALNDLARRMLLTTAAVPDGVAAQGKQTLTAMRLEKLIAMGAVGEAWKLAALVQPGALDDITTRLLIQAELVGPDHAAACEKIPALMDGKDAKTDVANSEWQKALIVCKLQANDNNAVQLGLDLLREQGAKDDTFMMLVTRNVIAKSKVLPRRLTPLQAIDLAVLRQMDLPLPSEVYARPEAAQVAELLQTKAVDEKARLKLAERMAQNGTISPQQLASVYSSLAIAPDAPVEEKGPVGRAAAYQQALIEATPQKKVELTQRFLSDAPVGTLTGSLGGVAAGLLADVPVISDYNSFAAQGARVMALAGQTDKAKPWVKLALDVGDRIPDVQKQLIADWPLYVLSGLVADADYAHGLTAWLDQTLAASKDDQGKDKDLRAQREQAGSVLLLLSAAGYAVSEEAWMRVVEAVSSSRQMNPSPILLERLRLAGVAQRKGETALLALLVGADGGAAQPVSVSALMVRALQQAGFEAEAKAFAREALVGLLYP